MKNLFIAILLVALCAGSALADRPPKVLAEHILAQSLKHDKKCNFRQERGVQCLIYWQEDKEIVWLVLFDTNLNVTRMVAVKEGVETVLWCRADVCI